MWIHGKIPVLCIVLLLLNQGYAQTVKASSFGFHPENATACLQAAINSNARKVIVDYQGKDWIIEPVTLVSDQEIIFENNVIIRARKGAFKGKDDSLFTATGKKNIILRGFGSVKMIMNKADYQSRLYTPAEWRHCLNFLSCENVRIENLTLLASGGDGIYLGNDWKNKGISYCRNIRIENLVVAEQHRQGISVISAEDLLIRNCSFNNTSGTPPAAGIDFEPNNPGERLVNCVLENCAFKDNQGSGIEFFLNALNEKSVPVSVTIKGCVMEGNAANIRFMQGQDENVRGEVYFQDSMLVSNGRQNVSILGLGSHFRLGFANLKIENTRNPSEAFSIASGFESMGGIRFDNVSVTERKMRPAIGVNLFQGKLPTGINAFGDITLNGKRFDVKQFCREHETFVHGLQQKKWKVKTKELAVKWDRKPLENAALFRIRSPFQFLQYCRAGETLNIDVSAKAAGRNRSRIALTVHSPAGELIRSRKLDPGETLRLNDKADKTGFYRIKCNPENNLAIIASKMPGQAIVPDGILQLMNPVGSLYFEVPAGVENFSLMAAGDPGEYVTVTLRNPEGKTILRREHFDTPYIFHVTRENKNIAEIWSISFENAVEDVSILLGSALNPLLAVDPALLLRKK